MTDVLFYHRPTYDAGSGQIRRGHKRSGQVTYVLRWLLTAASSWWEKNNEFNRHVTNDSLPCQSHRHTQRLLHVQCAIAASYMATWDVTTSIVFNKCLSTCVCVCVCLSVCLCVCLHINKVKPLIMNWRHVTCYECVTLNCPSPRMLVTFEFARVEEFRDIFENIQIIENIRFFSIFSIILVFLIFSIYIKHLHIHDTDCIYYCDH